MPAETLNEAPVITSLDGNATSLVLAGEATAGVNRTAVTTVVATDADGRVVRQADGAGATAHIQPTHPRLELSVADHRLAQSIAPAQRHDRDEPAVPACPAANRVPAGLWRGP